MLFFAIIVIILLWRAHVCVVFIFIEKYYAFRICVCVCERASGQCECVFFESCQPPLCDEHSICDSDKYAAVMIYELLLLAASSKLGEQFNVQRGSGSITSVAFSLIVSLSSSYYYYYYHDYFVLCLFTHFMLLMK